MKFYLKPAILLLLLVVVLSSCYSHNTEPREPETYMLTLKYELEENEELEPFYVSDTKIYAAVNKPEQPSMSAPSFGVTTEKFIVYNLLNEKEEACYSIDEDDAYIYHAIPFKDGILYAVYIPLEPDAVLNERVQWKIKYISDEGSKELDSGFCSSKFDMIPGFTVLDGDVYYLYETFDEKTGHGFGINRADLDHPKTVVKEADNSLSETEFRSNGTDYVIHVDGKLLIGNAKGIYQEYTLTEKMSDFGICENYLFCCTTSDGKKWTARSISLETGEEYTTEIEMPLYRISSMTGNMLTCVDEHFSMYLFSPGKEFEILPVKETPEIIENREYVRYYPYEATKTLAQLDEIKFCQIIW